MNDSESGVGTTASGEETASEDGATEPGIGDTDPGTVTSPTVQRVGGLVAVVGTWIFWSPIVLTGFGYDILTTILAGAAIATLAAYNVTRPGTGKQPHVAITVLVVLLGIWVAVTPFVMEVTPAILGWSNVISGALVVLLGAVAGIADVRYRR